MALTKEEFDEICKLVCPQCRMGAALRQRQDTGEWVHDHSVAVGVAQRYISHGLCWSNGLRNSDKAPIAGE